MKKISIFLSMLLLSISCVTLSPAKEPQPTSTLQPTSELEPTSEPVMRIPTTDPDQPMEVQAGETFEIVIDSNPTTGYHWELIGELDTNVVQFVSRDYIQDEPVKPGSGGVDVWTFQAVSVGQVQIVLGSYPPSNDVTDPQQTVTFDVIVK